MNTLSKIKLTPEEPIPETTPPLPVSPTVPDEATAEKRSLFRWKPFPWKDLLKSKNLLIGACVMLIVVAAYLNIRFSAPSAPPTDETPKQPENQTSGNGDESTVLEEDNYFAVAVINRERVRDEALDLLQTVAESEDSTVEAREEAYAEMSRIASEITYETNIENLIRSKGFTECVAVMNGDNVNIVVKTDGLTVGEVSQIKEIVYQTSGTAPDNIKIIEKQ